MITSSDFRVPISKYTLSDYTGTVRIWIESDHLQEVVSKVQIAFLIDVEKGYGLYLN